MTAGATTSEATVDFATWMRVSDHLQAYADAIDRGDVPGILALFTPDAAWDYSPTVTRRGHGEIGAFFAERLAAFARTSHNVGPPVVRPGAQPGHVRSTAYFQGKHLLHDGSMYCVWGRYVDDLVPTGGRLLFARRAVLAHVTEGTTRTYTMLPRVTD